jgi:4-hydroxy-3-methylbut-2-en-1-yl diphosphate synthase IspG/GcpE
MAAFAGVPQVLQRLLFRVVEPNRKCRQRALEVVVRVSVSVMACVVLAGPARLA